MRLVSVLTGLEIRPGDLCKTFHGDPVFLERFTATRVQVTDSNGRSFEYFPSVIGARVETAPQGVSNEQQ